VPIGLGWEIRLGDNRAASWKNFTHFKNLVKICVCMHAILSTRVPWTVPNAHCGPVFSFLTSSFFFGSWNQQNQNPEKITRISVLFDSKPSALRIITAPTFKNLNAFDYPGLLNIVLNLVCALLVSLVCVLNLVCALNGSTGTAVCVHLCTHTRTPLFRTFESMKICYYYSTRVLGRISIS
jgi:hypothetical protein